jgi:ElaB/YqjD/DUF883 family membrane-anchored ribosome-binding protein
MSQNRSDNETTRTSGSTGSTGSGTSGDPSQWGTRSGAGSTGGDTSSGLSTTGSGGAATGTATAPDRGGITAKAKEYGQTVADAATQAKDYLSEKAGVVGEKFQDLRNKDYGQIADEAKDYARQNPGQALLIAAAAGFVIGLLVRGGRR